MKNFAAIILLSATALNAVAGEQRCSENFTTHVLEELGFSEKVQIKEAMILVDIKKDEVNSQPPAILAVNTCLKLLEGGGSSVDLRSHFRVSS